MHTNSRNIILSGAFSTGKTTVFNELKKDAFLFPVPDGARVWLEKNKLNSNKLNKNQKADLQESLIKYYVDGDVAASHIKKTALMDSSLIEVHAYSQNILPPNLMNVLEILLSTMKHDTLALVFPPTIKLENDNLRHTDASFRIELHTRIMQLVHKFKIPFELISGASVGERVEEVQSYIPKTYSRI